MTVLDDSLFVALVNRNYPGEYGIVANVYETDHLFPTGAKVWIGGGEGGQGWHRFRFVGRTRGGRIVEKWAPTFRFHNFRSAWIPDHLRGRVYYLRGTREEMTDMALRLESFASEDRTAHPNRRAAVEVNIAHEKALQQLEES